jgi:hypothetical protein
MATYGGPATGPEQRGVPQSPVFAASAAKMRPNEVFKKSPISIYSLQAETLYMPAAGVNGELAGRQHDVLTKLHGQGNIEQQSRGGCRKSGETRRTLLLEEI